MTDDSLWTAASRTSPNAWGEPRTVHDVYVRVLNVARVGLVRTSTVSDTDDSVMLDWEVREDGSRRLVGVEVLGARGVEMDGLDVVNRRPHGTGPEWRPQETT